MTTELLEKIELKNLKNLLIDKGIITQKELDDKMKDWKFELNIEFKPMFNQTSTIRKTPFTFG